MTLRPSTICQRPRRPGLCPLVPAQAGTQSNKYRMGGFGSPLARGRTEDGAYRSEKHEVVGAELPERRVLDQHCVDAVEVDEHVRAGLAHVRLHGREVRERAAV